MRHHLYLNLVLLVLTAGALGLSFFFSPVDSLSAYRPKAGNIDQYWQATGLKDDVFVDLVDSDQCYTSERYFLACVNAISSVAQRLDKSLSSETLKIVDRKKVNLLSTELGDLEPWKAKFAEVAEHKAIDFVVLWNDLKEIFSVRDESVFVAQAMNSFISVFKDPHTYLLPVAYFKDVVSRVDQRANSLGIILGRSSESYFLKRVHQGSPAAKAGLKRGDVVLSYNNIILNKIAPSLVTDILKGEVGEQVRFVILRNGQRQVVKFAREEVTLPTVTYQLMPGLRRSAVITLTKFAKGSCDLMVDAIEKAKSDMVRGLMLDLRENPGGQMDEAACIVSLFVGPNKPVFSLRYMAKEHEEIVKTDLEQIYSGPLAILINESSASASEIVAGALQDYSRAVLVGERTFGKGSFQEGEVWSKNSRVALFETKGFYYLPSGRSPQLLGLTPDVAVQFRDSLKLREENQFVYPLAALPRSTWPVASTVSLNNCDFQEELSERLEDMQMATAQEVLFCSGVAGSDL